MLTRALRIAQATLATSNLSPASLLQQRKLLYQSTSNLLSSPQFVAQQSQTLQQPLSAYCGYDPTSDSLHLGNLVSIIMMARLHLQLGIRPIFLLGGATGLIGDPSGKKQERTLLEQKKVEDNLNSIASQIRSVYQALQTDLLQNHGDYGVNLVDQSFEPLFVNNYDFYSSMNVLHYLRDVGKVLRMSSLLSKQIVANRLQSETGLSYTEFSYSILQAYDFYQLHKLHGCSIQLGGSDQWGNITNGCDLVRRFTQGQSEVFGLTMPLLLSKTGQKFGKSAGNALFLNKDKTPISQIYDYLLSTPDDQIENLLYIFTFFSPARIENTLKDHLACPEKRIGQRLLADKVTALLGGYFNAKQELLKLSEDQLKAKSLAQMQRYFSELPADMKFIVEANQEGKSLPDLLCSLKITGTKKQARREIEGEGIYLNNGKIPGSYCQEDMGLIESAHRLAGGFLVVRRGKKKCYLIKFI